jgi:hypothetical protein
VFVALDRVHNTISAREHLSGGGLPLLTFLAVGRVSAVTCPPTDQDTWSERDTRPSASWRL